MKRFIVTGWPCSGTAYTAALFSTLGVRCGHEKVFGIAFLSDGRREKFPWARIAPIAGDLAAHYGYETPVADRAG